MYNTAIESVTVTVTHHFLNFICFSRHNEVNQLLSPLLSSPFYDVRRLSEKLSAKSCPSGSVILISTRINLYWKTVMKVQVKI